jgi:hypothetical protein
MSLSLSKLRIPANSVLVFGSNLSGRHGRGSAKLAVEIFGAKYGNGHGPQGNAYALPTKDYNLNTLSIQEIRQYINGLFSWARLNYDKYFIVVKVGCGLAGYRDFQIAPLFVDAPSNCMFHVDWEPYLPNTFFFHKVDDCA